MAWLGGLALLIAIPVLLFSQRLYLPIAKSPLPAGGTTHSMVNLLIAVILVGAVVSCIARFSAGVAAAGSALVLVGLALYLDIAVGRSQVFSLLLRQADWLNDAYAFDSTYLPRNVAVEPSLWTQFRFDTVWDRLVTGWYFMGLGWNLMMAAGLVIYIAAARALPARLRWGLLFLSLLGSAALLVFFLSGPLMAQRAFVKGALAAARGDGRAARDFYWKAIQSDRWFAMNLQLRERIGAIETSQGRFATPEARVFEAERLVAISSAPGAIGQLPRAIAIYDDLAAGDSYLAAAAANRARDLEAAYGLNLFSDGAFGEAVESWEALLSREPTMWLAKYYLSRGYYVMSRYQAAADLSRETLAETSDPRVLADLYSNLGDALTRLNQYDDAHLAYFQAYKLAYLGDYRGLNALVGN